MCITYVCGECEGIVVEDYELGLSICTDCKIIEGPIIELTDEEYEES